MTENKDTYFPEVKCHNCKHPKHFTIPKGKLIEDWLFDEVCGFCKCPIIKPKKKRNDN